MHSNLISHLEGLTQIQGNFSIPFVVLSLLFACLGAYTAFTMNEKINHPSFFPKSLWFLLASFAMGFGIWSMHYMGMFAYELPIVMKYDVFLTGISIVPVLLASLFAFYISYKRRVSLKVAVLSSFVMGLGVIAMHFIGMSSMQIEARSHYNHGILLFTFFIAFFSFFLFYTVRNYLHKISVRLLFSILMGLCLSLTHYSAMFGLKLFVSPEVHIFEDFMPNDGRTQSAWFLTLVFACIVLFLLTSIIADNYTMYRAENFDTLTKLPNLRKLEQAIENQHYYHMAVLNIKEVQNMKEISFLRREKYLREIVAIISEYKQPSSEIYRSDYYQFTILNRNESSDFEKNMKKIVHLLHNPIELEPSVYITPQSMCIYAEKSQEFSGVSLFEQIKSMSSKVASCYKNEVICFDSLVKDVSMEDELLEDVYSAMINENLFIVYQPKFSPELNQFENVEALIRWNHPKYGFISPAKFIPILEKNNQIIDLTNWIIQKVSKQLASWRDQQTPIRVVSVNIPGNYLIDEHLVHELNRAIVENQLSTNQIELELTETSFVGNIEKATEAVQKLHEQGYLVALDDFGTGLSSLSYLKQLPISTLKIDKSFVDGIPHSQKDSEILLAIVNLAMSLHLNVVIEGVEEEEQVNFIRAHFPNCLIQGYFYSKPLPEDEIAELALSNTHFITQ